MGTTPTYALPYPEEADPADVPVDMRELAEAIDAALAGVGVADGSVTTIKLADKSVTTVKLGDLAVTTAKLADGSVTSAKIADGSILASDLALGAVLAAIAADSIDASKLAPNSVGASELADNAVDTNALQNGSVTAAKLAAGVGAAKCQGGRLVAVLGTGQGIWNVVNFAAAGFTSPPSVVVSAEDATGDTSQNGGAGAPPNMACYVRTVTPTTAEISHNQGGTRNIYWAAVGT